MTNVIPKIAITGKLRSGKSLAAYYLRREHDFDIVSFGSSLKHYADRLFVYSDVYPNAFDEREFRYRKPRRLYQDFGEKMRELDPCIWIKHVEASVEILEDIRSTSGIVIDDLRQPHEYEWCKDNGFTIVRISANEDTRIARAKAAGDDFSVEDLTHETEQYVDGFSVDYDIVNSGGKAELERKIDGILAEISERESVV